MNLLEAFENIQIAYLAIVRNKIRKEDDGLDNAALLESLRRSSEHLLNRCCCELKAEDLRSVQAQQELSKYLQKFPNAFGLNEDPHFTKTNTAGLHTSDKGFVFVLEYLVEKGQLQTIPFLVEKAQNRFERNGGGLGCIVNYRFGEQTILENICMSERNTENEICDFFDLLDIQPDEIDKYALLSASCFKGRNLLFRMLVRVGGKDSLFVGRNSKDDANLLYNTNVQIIVAEYRSVITNETMNEVYDPVAEAFNMKVYKEKLERDSAKPLMGFLCTCTMHSLSLVLNETNFLFPHELGLIFEKKVLSIIANSSLGNRHAIWDSVWNCVGAQVEEVTGEQLFIACSSEQDEEGSLFQLSMIYELLRKAPKVIMTFNPSMNA